MQQNRTLPWDISCVPSPGASCCPTQPALCLPAHKLRMPQDWGASGIQSMNSKIADCCFFSLFPCFFPIAKQLQPPVGWCSGSGGCSCSQPRKQNSSCVAVTPALTPQIPSQPQSAVLGALCSLVFTATPRAVLQEGWTQAVVASGRCNSRVRAGTAL